MITLNEKIAARRLETCPVYDCYDGTIVRDDGTTTQCYACKGRGVVDVLEVDLAGLPEEALKTAEARYSEARSRLDAEILDHARTMRELDEARRYSIDNASTSDLVWALVERAVRRVLR